MIPLSALYFDATGKLKADRWPSYSANAVAVNRLVARMVKEGVLRQGLKPAAKPAFTATSITPGSLVQIEIEISAVVPDTGTPATSKADFKVTEKDLYTGLEPGTLEDTIGTAANGGKRPGLVFVSSGGIPELPKAGTYSMAGDPATVDIPKDSGAGDAFSLQTRSGGTDAALTSIEITAVDAAANKFAIIAKWTKSSVGLAMTGVGAAFAFVLTVAAPADGFRAPVEGKISLSGGSDAVSVAAVKPSATILAQ